MEKLFWNPCTGINRQGFERGHLGILEVVEVDNGKRKISGWITREEAQAQNAVIGESDTLCPKCRKSYGLP